MYRLSSHGEVILSTVSMDAVLHRQLIFVVLFAICSLSNSEQRYDQFENNSWQRKGTMPNFLLLKLIVQLRINSFAT